MKKNSDLIKLQALCQQLLYKQVFFNNSVPIWQNIIEAEFAFKINMKEKNSVRFTKLLMQYSNLIQYSNMREISSLLAHAGVPKTSQVWKHFFSLYTESMYPVHKRTEIGPEIHFISLNSRG